LRYKGTSEVDDFHTKFAEHHPAASEARFWPATPGHAIKQTKARVRGANIALFDLNSFVCLFVIN